MPIIPQTLINNNQRITGAKSINLNIIRKITKKHAGERLEKITSKVIDLQGQEALNGFYFDFY